MSGGTLYSSDGKELFTSNNPAKVVVSGSLPAPSGTQDTKIVSALPSGTNNIGAVSLYNSSTAKTAYINSTPTSQDASASGYDSLYTSAYQMAFNGGSYDRVRNNFEGTMITSGKRTSSAISSLITNYNARGLLLYLDVTQASGTGGLKLIVRGKDPTTGTMKDLYSTTTAITAVGSAVYAVAPAISFTGSRILQTFNGLLPRVFDVYVLAGDSSEYTYTLGYALLL